MPVVEAAAGRFAAAAIAPALVVEGAVLVGLPIVFVATQWEQLQKNMAAQQARRWRIEASLIAPLTPAPSPFERRFPDIVHPLDQQQIARQARELAKRFAEDLAGLHALLTVVEDPIGAAAIHQAILQIQVEAFLSEEQRRRGERPDGELVIQGHTISTGPIRTMSRPPIVMLEGGEGSGAQAAPPGATEAATSAKAAAGDDDADNGQGDRPVNLDEWRAVARELAEIALHEKLEGPSGSKVLAGNVDLLLKRLRGLHERAQDDDPAEAKKARGELLHHMNDRATVAILGAALASLWLAEGEKPSRERLGLNFLLGVILNIDPLLGKDLIKRAGEGAHGRIWAETREKVAGLFVCELYRFGIAEARGWAESIATHLQRKLAREPARAFAAIGLAHEMIRVGLSDIGKALLEAAQAVTWSRPSSSSADVSEKTLPPSPAATIASPPRKPIWFRQAAFRSLLRKGEWARADAFLVETLHYLNALLGKKITKGWAKRQWVALADEPKVAERLAEMIERWYDGSAQNEYVAQLGRLLWETRIVEVRDLAAAVFEDVLKSFADNKKYRQAASLVRLAMQIGIEGAQKWAAEAGHLPPPR
ncbi:MAG: hypothetical protein HYV03_04400 [Deltaproteobacteria bacterium]|nr:hypothetical protein [Deltaproteobacteria bacterium]